MKRSLFLFVALFAGVLSLHATHNIAGEITASCINGLTYQIKVTTYTNALSPADRCELTVSFGDATSQTAFRSNGPSGSCAPPALMGVDLTSQGYPNTKENIYLVQHTFPGPGTYIISISDPNRIAGISNIPNSVNVPFYIQTTLTIDPIIGCNSTPTLTTIPLDKACVGHCYYHNPGAVDPDGDSLSFSIGPCLDTTGLPIAGYTLPNVIGGGNLSMDPVTGDLSWCSPQVAGRYNLVIYINEWKKLPNGTRVKIGTILRDMDITVESGCNNENPEILGLNDTCIDAGTTLNGSFQVDDPNAPASDVVFLHGYGSPFSATPPATYTPFNTGVVPPYPFTATYSWQTNCNEVRLQPWIFTFKATDNDPNVPLSDIKSFNVTVVSPGPTSLTAIPQGTSMNLSWTPCPCNPTGNFLTGYKVYRKQGCNTWMPSHCETGVPGYTGYVLIGVTSAGVTTFVDNNGGNGLVPGIDYSYRVCADFHDGAESYASPEACAELTRDVPVIINVDVMSTGATNSDSIFVRWINALPDSGNFDTLAHPGPYVLKIRQSQGFVMGANPQLVQTYSSAAFANLPTVYVDHNLNTATTSYCYRISFFASGGADSIGACQPASSVYLTTTPSDNTVTLSWRDTVPWTNYDTTAIYRFNNATSLWDSIGISQTHSYADGGRENGVQYCYYVTTHGSYFNPSLPAPLYNRSQRTCAVPEDLTPPCPPNLIVNSDCYLGQNQLIWTNPINMNCGTDDVVSYNIWYAPTEDTSLYIIETITVSSDTTIIFGDLSSVAGCYAVTALDTFANQSALSNIVCQDNCPEYSLPNVFTPNSDGTNDFLIPFPYRQIKDIDLKIYDRWGALVFQTTDPAINWNGKDMHTGKPCTDGVYYYVCLVDEIHLDGIHQRLLKGFVHLFSKNPQQSH